MIIALTGKKGCGKDTVANYLCDKFPSKCIKMYIHHCIYDSPLTEKKKELETALRFSNYNYILLSSNFVCQ